jgi:hypothetical protein
MMANELSVLREDEREEWRQLRQVVGDSLRDWCEALRIIRDKRLYREDYQTFEAYCQIELGKTRQRINSVMNAELIRIELAADPSLERILSKTSVGAIEEIAKAPECARKKVAVKVAKEAEETGKPPTAKQVKRVVAEVIAEPKPEPDPVKHVDIHFPAADLAAQVLELAGQFVQIKRKLTALGKQPGGELCKQIASDSDWAFVDTLRNRILNSAFARVCPHCSGKGCKRCLDRGWQCRADVTLDERAGL